VKTLVDVRQSVFNVTIPGDQRSLLYNTLSGRLIGLKAALPEIIALSDPVAQELKRSGFLVDASISPEAEYEEFFRLRSQLSETCYLLFTTNTTCNLSCGYCFQNRVKRSGMSESVLRQSLSWIRHRLSATNCRSVNMTVFGGEPMLALSQVFDCLQGVRNICLEAHIEMEPCLLTTNGLHSDADTLNKLRTLGVEYVQITLDGAAAVNDRRRRDRLKTVEGSVYSNILANLRLYQRYFRLTVKVNFDKSTIDSIPKLLDDLEILGGIEPGSYRVKPEPIAVFKKTPTRGERPISLYDPTQPELASAFAKVIGWAVDRGIDLDLSAVFPTPCMISQGNSFLLEPDGSLRSCISAFGLDAFKVGSVFQFSELQNDRSRYSTDIDTIQLKDCLQRKCPYLPVCDGGCKYEAHLEGLPLKSMQCKYDYFVEAVPLYARYKETHSRSMRVYSVHKTAQ
jgi:uncharacterized protein